MKHGISSLAYDRSQESDMHAAQDFLHQDKKAEIEKDIDVVYLNRPALAMVDSRKGITNLHVPNNIIIDASMPNVVRDGGRMWNKDDQLQDTLAMIPDRCYATMYQEIISDCQKHGQFDPSTMGSVSNVGLMAHMINPLKPPPMERFVSLMNRIQSC